MTVRKIVYLNNDNKVIFPFILDDSNPMEERWLVAIDSAHAYVEVENSVQADFGWIYDGVNLIDSSENIFPVNRNFDKTGTRKLLCIVGDEVATYISWPSFNSKFSNLAEQMTSSFSKVEVDPSLEVEAGWQYDGNNFSSVGQ